MMLWTLKHVYHVCCLMFVVSVKCVGTHNTAELVYLWVQMKWTWTSQPIAASHHHEEEALLLKGWNPSPHITSTKYTDRKKRIKIDTFILWTIRLFSNFALIFPSFSWLRKSTQKIKYPFWHLAIEMYFSHDRIENNNTITLTVIQRWQQKKSTTWSSDTEEPTQPAKLCLFLSALICSLHRKRR